MHIDFDMFYPAVEIWDNAMLEGRPVAVGEKGIVSTSNYIAWKKGVKSGMPIFIARKLIPEIVIIKPNFNKYKAVSDELKTLLR